MTNKQGCGRGYDVAMLALHGFDAWGLEISSTAVATAEKYASSEVQSPGEHNFGSAEYRKPQAGEAKLVEGDFFKSGWEDGQKFDVIYDYTVCLIASLVSTN